MSECRPTSVFSIRPTFSSFDNNIFVVIINKTGFLTSRLARRWRKMRHFEYDITRHSSESLNQVIVFCSEGGQCNLEDIPHSQTAIFRNLLNDKGREGWELADIAFGKDGILAFWKRELAG
jgi:hypothetical protein